MRCVVGVRQQWGDPPLKSTDSKADIPIPRDLANMLNASVQMFSSEFMVTAGHGTDRCGSWLIQRAVREAKADVDGLPERFSFHDLRHHYASLLISSGENVKTVQKRMRHASARTTLDIYSHCWPGAGGSTRTAVGAAIMQRMNEEKEAQ
jgi:integrase